MWKQIIINNIKTNYDVSDIGEIRNRLTNRLLSQRTQQGYKHVTLAINGKPKSCRVHRLVAQAFIENPDNKPYVNHINGQRDDNHVENLEWVTPAENTQHAVRTNLMPPTRMVSVVQYDLDGNKIAVYKSITEAAQQTGSAGPKITLCCQKQRASHNNFQWRYASEEVEKLPPTSPTTTAIRVAQIDKNTDEVIAIYDSITQAAHAVGGTPSAIIHILKGDKQTYTHKNYKWKKVDDIVQ